MKRQTILASSSMLLFFVLRVLSVGCLITALDGSFCFCAACSVSIVTDFRQYNNSSSSPVKMIHQWLVQRRMRVMIIESVKCVKIVNSLSKEKMIVVLI